ncbi:hypothetical protein [Neobacillus jeddahensis]|uniref:hypothetical protein n=1 Tax=Neobacillus jeddahensis TaxID=1461580 RepID=UPI0011560A44|nr:hypothetical protein [Neobacillus jeddahensis]
MQWQLENIETMLKQHEINLQVAFPLLKRINRILYFLTKEDKYKTHLFQSKWFKKGMRYIHLKNLSFKEKRQQQMLLEESNRKAILNRLEEFIEQNSFPREIIDFFILIYSGRPESDHSAEEVQESFDLASQIERELIQKYFEKGKINRGEVKELRDNLLVIENALHTTGQYE